MIVKGIVSAIDTEAKAISVILPEYNNVVTRPIKVYQDNFFDSLKVNDFVLVAVFNNDFNDCIVINSKSNTAETIQIAVECYQYFEKSMLEGKW